MSELVDLLRTPTGACPPTKWELQAADRIEALEAALRWINAKTDDRFAAEFACAALAEEQDK